MSPVDAFSMVVSVFTYLKAAGYVTSFVPYFFEVET